MRWRANRGRVAMKAILPHRPDAVLTNRQFGVVRSYRKISTSSTQALSTPKTNEKMTPATVKYRPESDAAKAKTPAPAMPGSVAACRRARLTLTLRTANHMVRTKRQRRHRAVHTGVFSRHLLITPRKAGRTTPLKRRPLPQKSFANQRSSPSAQNGPSVIVREVGAGSEISEL